MPFVTVKDSEPADIMLRRFKRACEKENVLSDIRKHEYYIKPKWQRRQMRLAAIKRFLKKRAKEQEPFEHSRGT